MPLKWCHAATVPQIVEIDGRLANGNSFGEEEPAQRILFQSNGHEEHLAQVHLTIGIISHRQSSPPSGLSELSALSFFVNDCFRTLDNCHRILGAPLLVAVPNHRSSAARKDQESKAHRLRGSANEGRGPGLRFRQISATSGAWST